MDTPARQAATPRWLLAVRGLCMLACVGVLVYGPVARQVLERHDVKFLRGWSLYHAQAVGVCVLALERRTPDGGREAVDRPSLLGVADARDLPRG